MNGFVTNDNRRLWIVRGVFLGWLVLVIALLGLSLTGSASTRLEGDATVYKLSPRVAIGWIASGALTAVFAVWLLLQSGSGSKVIGGLMAVLATMILTAGLTFLVHRLVVRPDSMTYSSGLWFAPREHTIDFCSTSFLNIESRGEDRNGRILYELVFVTQPNDEVVELPFFDLLQKGLPEIIRQAEAQHVRIDDGARAWSAACFSAPSTVLAN